MPSSFDVVVVGSGPAGAVAATCLARGGAKVALIDRVHFPRDKACGDLLSPRAVAAFQALDIAIKGARPVGDMRLVGPGGRSEMLPWPEGESYPSHAYAVPRLSLDEELRQAALEAGAEFIHGDVERVDASTVSPASVRLKDGNEIAASFV